MASTLAFEILNVKLKIKVMKTIRIFTLITVLVFTGMVSGQSKENNSAEKQEIKTLKKNLNELFKDIPFEDVMCGEKECKLSVCFKVKDDGSLQIYHIIGKNEKLVDYSKKVFASEEVKVNNLILNDGIYWIKIVFKYNEI